jgi:hypothetical protein
MPDTPISPAQRGRISTGRRPDVDRSLAGKVGVGALRRTRQVNSQ